MALPHMSNEDPVRLALLCQTVAKLFNKNGDEKMLSIKNKFPTEVPKKQTPAISTSY